MADFLVNHHHLSNDNSNNNTLPTNNTFNNIDNVNNDNHYDDYNYIGDEDYYNFKGMDIADVMMLRSAATSSLSYDDSLRGTGEWVSLSLISFYQKVSNSPRYSSWITFYQFIQSQRWQNWR